MNARATQRGFILMTSLIFLVVITILALAAMNRSTLQQKIATNTQAREVAMQHATAALNAAEQILSSKAFDTYQRPGPKFDLPDDAQSTVPADFHIWRQGGIPDTNTNTAQDFLDPAVWDGPDREDQQAPVAYITDDDKDSVTEYFVVELDGCYQANRSPEACATGRSVAYRITARATKGNTEVVVQSTFVKFY